MNFISDFFNFFINPANKPSSKFKVLAAALLLAYLANNIFGFSFYYNTEQKTEQISRITTLLQDADITSEERDQLLLLRKDVLARKSISDHVFLLIRSFSSQNQVESMATTDSLNTNTMKPTTNLIITDTVANTMGSVNTKNTTKNITVPVVIRNNIWFYFSSSWVFILFFIISPVMLFLPGSKLSDRFFSMVLLMFTMAASSLFHYWLFGFIPQFCNDSWAWNYVVNAILQVVLMFFYYYSFKFMDKTNKN